MSLAAVAVAAVGPLSKAWAQELVQELVREQELVLTHLLLQLSLACCSLPALVGQLELPQMMTMMMLPDPEH